jgi:hypothetical protein
MKDPAASIIAAGVVAAIVFCAVTTLAVEHYVYTPMRQRINVTVQPIALDIEAACPECGHLWQIKAGG